MMHSFLRFLGFRRLFAITLALVLTLTVRWLIVWGPPTGFDQWPNEARQVLSGLSMGAYDLAFGIWLAAMITPIGWWLPLSRRRIIQSLSLAALAGSSIKGALSVIGALIAMTATPPEYLFAALRSTAYVAGIPLLVGCLPLLLLEVIEHLRTLTWLKNWVYTGRGAHASWIAPYNLRRDTQPLPERLS